MFSGVSSYTLFLTSSTVELFLDFKELVSLLLMLNDFRELYLEAMDF